MAVIFSPSIHLAEPPGGFPLKHARIGYHTIATESNVIGSTELAGFPASSAANPLTYDRWQPTALPATWTVDYGEAVDVDYVGIAAHSFRIDPSTITIQHSADGVNFTDVVSAQFVTETAVMFIFEKQFKRYWRVKVEGTTIPEIGVIYVGELLSMERPFYGGHAPVTLSRKTLLHPSRSEGGQWLGMSKIRKAVATGFEWQHLTAAWYRDFFDPFVEHTAGGLPFFIAWNPEQFPEEVGYMWTLQDIQPSNMGIRDLMQVSFDATGYIDGRE